MERINQATEEPLIRGHRTRYHLAAGLLEPGDVILDAACGSGYGAAILQKHKNTTYIGVDRDLSETYLPYHYVAADLTTWTPGFAFDVFVGFETIEHLPSYDHYLQMAKRARKWIILSVPVIPTTHMNPWHLHDFGSGELVHLVEDTSWQLYQALGQPSEFSEIYLFNRTA